jgi:hypothetical protein
MIRKFEPFIDAPSRLLVFMSDSTLAAPHEAPLQTVTQECDRVLAIQQMEAKEKKNMRLY